MTQEEKQLLLKDLCARLPYGVKIMFKHNGFRWDWEQNLDDIKLCDDGEYAINGWGIHGIKPYLRPMSSMTEEEEGMYNLLQGISHLTEQHWTADDGKIYRYADAIDWLNENHFDYRGLIEKGLALEAPDGMYKM